MKNISNRMSGCWCLSAVILLSISGCAKYGPVCPRAYEHAKSLYSVCNTKNASRLSRVKEILDADEQAALLSAAETLWLRSIIEQAESGNWDAAASAARRLMQDQVKH